jgi:hypothetical protein
MGKKAIEEKGKKERAKSQVGHLGLDLFGGIGSEETVALLQAAVFVCGMAGDNHSVCAPGGKPRRVMASFLRTPTKGK